VAEQARGGHGQIVAAVGEAGAGKSRLMYEFKATIPDEGRVLEAYSVSHGKASAWLPVIDLLKSYFEIADEDDDSRRSEKVEAKARGLDPALAETLPYILSLLGVAGAGAQLAMDARIRRRRTLEAVKRIIIRKSLKQPLVVIFEDLHWIDAETQELLDLLVDSVASARILMLVNYRPEYHHEWSNRTCYTQLRLDPLGGQSAGEMLQALLGADASLQSLKRLIIDKTEGNPFFVEEIVRALVEQGVLVRNGATRLTKPLTEIRVPPTVQGILASRIDALPASEKGLLQTLAVIGVRRPFIVRQLIESLCRHANFSRVPRNTTPRPCTRPSIARDIRNALREKGSVRPLRSVPPSTPRKNCARKWEPPTFAPKPVSQPLSSRTKRRMSPVGSRSFATIASF
jgi:predicted ATPase